MKIRSLTLVSASAFWILTVIAGYLLGKNHGATRADTGFPGSLYPAAGQGKVTEQAENPLPLRGILAGIKEKLRSGGGLENPATMEPVMGLLGKIRPEDIPEALAEIERLTDPRQKTALLMALLGKWAAVDGPAAIDYAEKHAGEAGVMASVTRALVIGVWAGKDPEAVWQWYQKNGRTETGMAKDPMVLTALFSGLAADDPGKAFSRLRDFDGAARIMALSGIFQSAAFDPDKRRGLLQTADTLTDESDRTQARLTMLSQWTTVAPEEAAAWVKEQPAKDQAALRESAGSILLMNDPKKGAAFMLEGATEEDLPRRYGSIISQWASRDINAAGTWLREQPQGPHLDQARRMFVGVASEKDPASAMAWAGTITEPVQRLGSTTMAWLAWQKTDSAAAERALAGTDLTEEQKNTVRSSASPVSTRLAPPLFDPPVKAPPAEARAERAARQ